MEAIHAKRPQLEEQLEQREALVFMMRQLSRKLQAGEKLTYTDEHHPHIYSVMVFLDDEQKRLTASWLDLYKREKRNSKELQENHHIHCSLRGGLHCCYKIFSLNDHNVHCLENMLISGSITVGSNKRMGKLYERLFQVACKRKYMDDNSEAKAASLVSSWQEEIQKPSWRPFATIQVDGEDKECIQFFYSIHALLFSEFCGESLAPTSWVSRQLQEVIDDDKYNLITVTFMLGQ